MEKHFEIGDMVVHQDFKNDVAEVVGFNRGSGLEHLRFGDGSMYIAGSFQLTHYRPTPEQVAHQKALEAIEWMEKLHLSSFDFIDEHLQSPVYAIVHAAVLDVMCDE